MPMSKIEDISPGSVLAADVRLKGRTLAQAGTELTEQRIAMLKRMGVDEVDLANDESAARENLLMRMAGYIHGFFLFLDADHPAHQAIFEQAVLRAVDRVDQGWTPPGGDELAARNVEHLRDIFFKGEGMPEDVVRAETEVASFPDVYFKIRRAMDDPNSSAKDIAKAAATDVGLSTKLLKLVNSPLYGFSQQVDSISRAVALVGVRELTTLALGMSAMNYFKDIPPELADMRSFWRHSISCAVFAKILAAMFPGAEPEAFFTAGLLHDVGRLIMFKTMPYASVQAMLYARENFVPLVVAEEEVMGFEHTEVARILMEEWKFPPDLVRAAAFHHGMPGDEPMPRPAALVCLADNLAHAAGAADGEYYCLPGMPPGAWEGLKLTPKHLRAAFKKFDEQIAEVTQIFLG